jgi:hypothetical protein
MQLPERRLVAEARWAETSGKGYRWEDRKQKTTTNVRENRCMKLFSPDASSPRLMRNN